MRFLLVCCAVLSCTLVACDKQPDGADSGGYGVISLFDPVAINPSLCGSPAIPFPNNALFSGTTDATLNIPNGSENTTSTAAPVPFVTAANRTDGFSTTGSMFTDVLGTVDYSTADDAILILEVDASPRFLTYGVDYTIQPSIAMAQLSGTGHSTGTCTGVAPARFMPISQQRSRLLIEPLKPLNPSTTYIVALTKALKSSDGKAIAASEQFPVANSDTKICKLGSTGSDATGSEPACSDPAAKAYAAAIAPVLGQMSATQLATIETLRRSLIRPTVSALKSFHTALRGSTLNDSDLAIAWSFTTQSVGLTLSRLNTSAVAPAFQVANTTISTGDLGLGLADTADIYAGIIQVPYYLANSSAAPIGGVPAPLATFWTSKSTLNAVNPPALGGAVPCSALGKSVSTSICYPDPDVAAGSTETIPIIVTVPNANSGQVKPANGWPVVVFQHGITRNRTDMLAIAPTLAAAGFVTVSIDQPLHGITNNCAHNGTTCINPFYRNQLFTGSPAAGLITGERTFDLDLMNNGTGASGSDGTIDSSGSWFVNLSSLITSRDNLRQSEADLLHLARSLGNLDLDQSSSTLSATDIDETKVRFVGQSLGAIVGTTVMAVDAGADPAVDGTDEVFGAASLNVPGGGIAKLLDASAAFGPRIAAGLAASFVFEGTDSYETFMRFAQHLIDPADPINYAVAANLNHPIHMTQVIGDTVVPNNAGTTCPAPAALPFGMGATATAVTAAGTAAASGQAGAALVALCPPLVIPATGVLSAITYQDETIVTGFLSGTDPLARLMGLATKNMGSAPFAAQTPAGADTLVVFGPDTAEHGTLLSPDASSKAGADTQFLPATCAEQTQTATFLASNGALLPLGGTCP
jgi:hypothetical protein